MGKYGLSWRLFLPVWPFLVSGVGLVACLAFGGLWGFSALLFFLPACRVHLQGEKSPFLHLVFGLSAYVPVCLCSVSIYEKRNGLLWVVSLGVVLWGFVSPIERKKGRLQVACRFVLLLLFCPCLSAFLLPWGLLYSINSLCRLHRCGLGIYR